MWKRGVVFGIVVLLTLALIPAYAVAGEGANGEDEGGINNATNTSTNVTVNATGLQKAAENLLRIVDRLANYTSSLMANATNVTNETLEAFNNAEELREEAWALYNNGSYKEALHKAIEAMRAYKAVIRAIRTGEEPEMPSNETIAKVEALRMNGYFRHVELLIRVAKMRGANVTEIEELLNQTREAYKKVVIDAMNGNSTALKEDLKTARELKRQLDEAIRELGKEFLKIRGRGIVMAFEKTLEMQIRALQRLQNVPGVNASVIQNITQQLMGLRQNVTELVREGKYMEAIALIKASTPKLKVVAMHLRWIEKKDEVRWPVWAPGRGRGHGHGGRP